MAGTWKQVIRGLLYTLHALTNHRLSDLKFGILLQEQHGTQIYGSNIIGVVHPESIVLRVA